MRLELITQYEADTTGGYDDTIRFLKGEVVEESLWVYQHNLLLYSREVPDGEDESDVWGNTNTNPHLLNGKRIQCIARVSDDSGNKYSIIDSVQMQPPNDIDGAVEQYLEIIGDGRLTYFREGRADEYIALKEAGEI